MSRPVADHPEDVADRGPLRFERRAMGSPLRLQVSGIDAAAAAAGWLRVTAEIEAAEEALSRFRDESEVTRLNRLAGSGREMIVSARLYRALAAAERARRVSDGRFDPRVLADLERLGSAGAPLGDLAVPEAGRRGAGPWLRRDPRSRSVGLSAPVDLGGIGKGLALRWAWRRLTAGPHPPLGALLEAGGDLVLGGSAPDGGPWRVGIEDPAGSAEPLAVIALNAGAVCTSSARIGRWRAPDGRLVHHLIDPRTGEPGGTGLQAVTVAAADPAWAEVWSKTLFLAGRREVGPLARSRGLAAWWVDDTGSLEMTPAARPATAWPA